MATTDRLLYISSDGLVRQLGFDPTAADLGGAAGVASSTHAATSKTTPVDADELPIVDSAASWGLKKLTWVNLKATLKTYFDTLYLGIAATAANASQLLGATWASPGTIGSTTPNSGAFTTLSATGNATLGDASTDIHTINGVLIQSVGAGVGITTGGNLTVSSPDGVEGGQVTLKNRANTAAAFVVDVDNVDQCRVFTAQNNTNITIGQIGGATGGSVAIHTGSTERVKIDSSGNVLVTSVAGLGYGTGSGGTVTQATSKSTAVTLNKPTGQITMNNAALADATTVVFGLTNSTIGANDTVVFTCAGGFGANYLVWAVNPAAGSVSVAVRNVSGVSQSQALVINFAVIKGANA